MYVDLTPSTLEIVQGAREPITGNHGTFCNYSNWLHGKLVEKYSVQHGVWIAPALFPAMLYIKGGQYLWHERLKMSRKRQERDYNVKFIQIRSPDIPPDLRSLFILYN